MHFSCPYITMHTFIQTSKCSLGQIELFKTPKHILLRRRFLLACFKLKQFWVFNESSNNGLKCKTNKRAKYPLRKEAKQIKWECLDWFYDKLMSLSIYRKFCLRHWFRYLTIHIKNHFKAIFSDLSRTSFKFVNLKQSKRPLHWTYSLKVR